MSKIPLSILLMPIHFFLVLRVAFIGSASKNDSSEKSVDDHHITFGNFLTISFESFALFSLFSLVTDFIFSIASMGSISRTFLLNADYQFWLLAGQLLIFIVISTRFFLRERNRNLTALILSELVLLSLFSATYFVTRFCFAGLQ